jgi:hypothetical protein
MTALQQQNDFAALNAIQPNLGLSELDDVLIIRLVRA